MDIEATLRQHLRDHADKLVVSIWANDENRMMLAVSNEDSTQSEFVVFGDNVYPHPSKPPTQAISVPAGIDAHGPMGAR